MTPNGRTTEFVRGSPLPLGATSVRGGVNFSIYSKRASAVTLVVFSNGTAEPALEYPLHPKFHKTGDVWHCFLSGLDPGVHYAYLIDGLTLLDPYGKAVAGLPKWNTKAESPLRSVVADDRFAWGLIPGKRMKVRDRRRATASRR